MSVDLDQMGTVACRNLRGNIKPLAGQELRGSTYVARGRTDPGSGIELPKKNRPIEYASARKKRANVKHRNGSRRVPD